MRSPPLRRCFRDETSPGPPALASGGLARCSLGGMEHPIRGALLALVLAGCGVFSLFGSGGDRHFLPSEYHLFAGHTYTEADGLHRWSSTTVIGTRTTEYRELAGKEAHERRVEEYKKSLSTLGTFDHSERLSPRPGEPAVAISLLACSQGFGMILTDERRNGHTFVATCSLATPSTEVEGAVGVLNLASEMADCRRRLLEIRRLATE